MSKIKHTRGSENIFADLGVANPEEHKTRALIGLYIIKLLKTRELKQREIADLLSINQPEVSHLMNGHFNHFTIDRLLAFLKLLNVQVSIHLETEDGLEVVAA